MAIIEIFGDSRRFSGVKVQALFLTLSTTSTEEVKVLIRSETRKDMLINPASINFANVKEGSGSTQSISLACALIPNFAITDLQCDSKYIVPRLVDSQSDEFVVRHKISATLRPDAPAGTWQTEIWISTNDMDTPRIRVPVTVEVEPQAATR